MKFLTMNFNFALKIEIKAFKIYICCIHFPTFNNCFNGYHKQKLS